MAEREERALQVTGMLRTAETLAMESRRMGERLHTREDHECGHCWGSGWVMMTAENDFGEDEDYFVLCRKCGRDEASVLYGESR